MGDGLNIVYHFRVRGTGAEGVHIAGISNGFGALGHRVRFVSPTGADPSVPAGAHASGGSKVSPLFWLADHLPQIFFEAMELSYNLFGTRKLMSVVRSNGPDLVYERYAFFNMAGVLVSKRFGIPFVVEVNELSGYDRVRGQVMVPLARRIEKAVFRQADLIVVVSAFLKEKIAALIGEDHKIVVIPNGVSREWVEARFNDGEMTMLRSGLGLADSRIVGFVGGLTHWHNFDFLLDMLKQLKNRYPDIVLLIVGDGPLREEIMKGAEKRQLRNAVVITGTVPHHVVRQYIDLFDVAVIPHSNQYRSPIKLFEYMGAARPVVAASTEPIETVIEQGRTGYTFPPGNIQAAVRQLAAVLDDSTLAAEFGDRAKDTIMRHYLWENHAAAILSALGLASH